MEIIDLIIKIASFLSALGIIALYINKIIKKLLNELHHKINVLEKNQCKNYLVSFLSNIEKGEETTECEKIMAYEMYDHYIKDLKGNSFIKDKWEKMMEK